MSTSYETTPATTLSTAVRPRLAAIGVASAIVAIGWTAFGAHGWAELLGATAAIAVATALVFGLVVPRALRKPSAPGTALALSVPAALLAFPAFWSGLPLVLGAAGAVLGAAGRTARRGSGRCILALVLGALAVVCYLFIYVADGVVAGHAGFLFD